MAVSSIELYVVDCPWTEVETWLREAFDEVTQVRTEPVPVFDATHNGTTVPVQITENVQGGRYTSIWVPADNLPWSSAKACARSCFDAIGRTVVCHLDRSEDEPWKMYCVDPDDGTTFVDRRQLDL